MDIMQNLRQNLSELPKEKLLDYIEMQFKNLWTLQNNYIVSLEEKFGHDVAIEFDSMCYGRLSEVTIHRLRKLFNLGDDIEAALAFLTYVVPEPGTEGEWFQIGDRKIVWRVTRCGMQLARKERGAPELPCKPALLGVMERRFKAINPRFRIVRTMAPPDPHPDDLWCEIEVELED